MQYILHYNKINVKRTDLSKKYNVIFIWEIYKYKKTIKIA